MPPLHKYWGDMSSLPIGIDAPADGHTTTAYTALSVALRSKNHWCKLCVLYTALQVLYSKNEYITQFGSIIYYLQVL